MQISGGLLSINFEIVCYILRSGSQSPQPERGLHSPLAHHQEEREELIFAGGDRFERVFKVSGSEDSCRIPLMSSIKRTPYDA